MNILAENYQSLLISLLISPSISLPCQPSLQAVGPSAGVWTACPVYSSGDS